MTIDNINFSFADLTTIEIPPDTKFVSCNFTQEKAHTKIFKGRTDLAFIGCNLKNCELDVPADQIIDCLYNVHADIDLTPILAGDE